MKLLRAWVSTLEVCSRFKVVLVKLHKENINGLNRQVIERKGIFTECCTSENNAAILCQMIWRQVQSPRNVAYLGDFRVDYSK